MATTLTLDPSRPYELNDDLLALWLPRGRGRDDLAQGLLATVDVCENPKCPCTIATLQAHRIDDRAMRAECDNDELSIIWRNTSNGHPRPEGKAVLELDLISGVVAERGGEKLSASVADFFEEPLPYWVLDTLWARWCAPRLPSNFDWKAQALKFWQPGELLSTMLAIPEQRPDCYLVDDRLYQVDTSFCVTPECDCTDARLSVLSMSEDRKTRKELGGAWLPTKTMAPADFEGEGLDHRTFVRIYLEWRRRNVPPEARLSELRDLTRRRGLQLCRLAEARMRSATSSSRPGRNAPCPCGSGKKYKRCCGK